MRAELARAGYGGPQDDEAILAAYERTTGGKLYSSETDNSGPTPPTTAVTPQGQPAAPVDRDAERRKIQANISALTPIRNDEGRLRSAWMKANSPLSFADWLALVREVLSGPMTFQQLRGMLVPS